MLDLDAAVHHRVTPSLLPQRVSLHVGHPQLLPQTAHAHGQCLLGNGQHVFAAAKHIDHIDRNIDGCQIRVTALAQDLGVTRIHRNDRVTRGLHVLGSEVTGAVPVGRQADHGNGSAALQNAAKFGVGVVHGGCEFMGFIMPHPLPCDGTHLPPQSATLSQALINRQVIAALCLAMAFFLTNDTLVKMASVQIGIFQSLFLRGALASLILSVVAWRMGAFRLRPGWCHPTVLWRAGIDAVASMVYMAGLVHLPLANATAINMTTPLLIGGATTSRIHTAVKISPVYAHPIVHVLDASRSVPVAGSLLSDETKTDFAKKIKDEYVALAENHAKRQSTKDLITIEDAIANRWKHDGVVIEPKKIGIHAIELNLSELVDTIDWTPFFQTWELAGQYPAILEDEIVGSEAKKLLHDAKTMLNDLVENKKLTAKGVWYILPAKKFGENVAVYNSAEDATNDVDGSAGLENFHFLRQQRKMAGGLPNYSLVDFIADDQVDYFGGFAVTTGIGLEPIVAAFEAQYDDYQSIMAKALADRLAESFAEVLHQKVRTEFWGYADEAKLSNEDLIREKYQGIRPAPGYPACPDHTEKSTLFNLLGAPESAGIILTESMAMLPAASVSGWYFAHPQSKYFGLGKINKDQVVLYAESKGMDLETAERWLSPVLAY